MRLLHIIASPRGELSRTLQVSKEFIENLKLEHPNLEIIELDLFKVDLPEVFLDVVNAKYALMGGLILDEKASKHWAAISAMSNDFLNYDIYLISNPMWNFSIPYRLKQYIDIIMQAGILFTYTEKGVLGLALNKKMYCITSRGSDYSQGSYMHQFDFQEPYLKAIFGLTGITDITFLNANSMDYTPELTLHNLTQVKEQAKLMAQNSRT